MSSDASKSVSELLTRLDVNDRPHQDVVDELYAAVYEELRRIAGRLARREPANATLPPTDLVHEAYLKLVNAPEITWNGRAHFLRVAAKAMRNILVDRARRRSSQKRGGGWQRISLSSANQLAGRPEIEVLALDRALAKLAQEDDRAARIVELRAFAGLTAEEAARVVGVSRRTADTDWKVARLWLAREMQQ